MMSGSTFDPTGRAPPAPPEVRCRICGQRAGGGGLEPNELIYYHEHGHLVDAQQDVRESVRAFLAAWDAGRTYRRELGALRFALRDLDRAVSALAPAAAAEPTPEAAAELPAAPTAGRGTNHASGDEA